MIDPLRVTEEPGTEPMLTEDDNAGVLLNEENNTYTIEESTRAFLELDFALKKSADKTCKIWETKFKVLESDATRCPKLNTIFWGSCQIGLIRQRSKTIAFTKFYAGYYWSIGSYL